MFCHEKLRRDCFSKRREQSSAISLKRVLKLEPIKCLSSPNTPPLLKNLNSIFKRHCFSLPFDMKSYLRHIHTRTGQIPNSYNSHNSPISLWLLSWHTDLTVVRWLPSSQFSTELPFDMRVTRHFHSDTLKSLAFKSEEERLATR